PAQDSRLAQDAPAPPSEIQYDTVLDWQTFEDWIERIKAAPLVAMDTETNSLDPMLARLVGISLCTEPGRACYIPLTHRGPDQVKQLPMDEVLARLKPWLEDDKAPKLLHNSKYDAHVL